MRRVHYAGGTVMVDDLTCKALLRYARALAQTGESDIVEIPVITDTGSQAHAHMLIGPSSQLFATTVDNAAESIVEDEVIAELERLTARLQPSRPQWSDELPGLASVQDFDFLDRADD
ncbi:MULTISPECIES: hypothetical protein [unclassified Leifsonia]|uniref:hypothetical protein n=1 Tax=unclassified Leifsonia TaxID=2663824 RepID=UPI0006FE6F2E|nr:MULTISPECIES: hypothetical protein [unclassified Leifsonia]KQX06916.1 hypothetical protein ASC59_03600 [Leifsonia sp. Root1293]KRA11201.1 hypothetical protein ASD61_03600 [Leifsonia sp. Root60]